MIATINRALRIASAAAGIAACPVQALPLYTIQDIGPVIGFPTTISNSGHVAGTYDFVPNTVWHAFLYTPGSGVRDLGSLGEGESSSIGVQAVNDSGQVTGSSFMLAGGAGWQGRAFLYSSQTGMQPIGTLGGSFSSGRAINNLGHVAGISTTSSGDLHMFVYDGASMTDLGLIGGVGGDVRGMNDAGQITGSIGGTTLGYRSEGFIYTPGRGFTQLGTLGGLYSVGSDINEAGFVAGNASTEEWIGEKGGFYRTHAVIFSPDGTPTDLGVLRDNEDSFATGLNDAGIAVGMSGGSPFLYADGAMVNLNTMLDAQSAEGWTSLGVDDINNDGLISGHGIFNGEPRAILLTPTEGGGGQCRVTQSVLRAAVAAVKERLGG